MNLERFFASIQNEQQEVDRLLASLTRFIRERWDNFRADAPGAVRGAFDRGRRLGRTADAPRQLAKFCRLAGVSPDLLFQPPLAPWKPWPAETTVRFILGSRGTENGHSVVATDDALALGRLMEAVQRITPCRTAATFISEATEWDEVLEEITESAQSSETVALVAIGSVVPNLACELLVGRLGVEVPVMRRSDGFGSRAQKLYHQTATVTFDMQPLNASAGIDAAFYLDGEPVAFREKGNADQSEDAGVVAFGDVKFHDHSVRLISLYGLGGRGSLLAARAAWELSEELEICLGTHRAVSVVVKEDEHGLGLDFDTVRTC